MNDSSYLLNKIFPWILAGITIAMVWFYPSLKAFDYYEVYDSNSILPIKQVVASFVFLLGVVIWGTWLGRKLVNWFADLVVNLIYSTNSSSHIESFDNSKSEHKH